MNTGAGGARAVDSDFAPIPLVPLGDGDAATGPGQRLYAIGDIHGRLDLLAPLLAAVARDIEAHPDRDPVLVFIGDYIDRGAGSRQVIDLVLRYMAGQGMTVVPLMGNHEAMLVEFLDGESDGQAWLDNGGVACLESYGIAVAEARSPDNEALRDAANSHIPPEHIDFLRNLRPGFAAGDYFFAHAGIRPGIPLEAQTVADMIWIRRRFLDSQADHGKVVVHGHTVHDTVTIRANRIAIDTGAWFSGRLSCLVLDGATRALLQMAAD